MSTTASNVPCADPVRLFVYEHLSSAFFRETPTSKGTCSVCGAKDMDVLKMSDTVACRAQAALTQKRHTAEKGHPVVLNAPLHEGTKQGRFSMVDKMCGILVEPDYAAFTGKVVPSKPLPAGAEIRTDLRFFDLLERVLLDPKPPYMLAAFDQKGAMPLEMSETTGTIVINGTEPPIRLSRRRLQQIVDLMTVFGIKRLEEASKMRGLVYVDPAQSTKILRSLEIAVPDLVARMDEIPNGPEPEYPYALAIVRSRLKKAGKPVPETDAEDSEEAPETETEEA